MLDRSPELVDLDDDLIAALAEESSVNATIDLTVPKDKVTAVEKLMPKKSKPDQKSPLPPKLNVTFAIDEQQEILLSTHKILSHRKYTSRLFSSIQLAWLDGNKVNYQGRTYQMTDPELGLLIDMLRTYQRTALFEKLWKSNARLPNYVFQMEGKKLYPLFCHLMKTPSIRNIFMEIWQKAEKLLPWLKLNDNKKLIELFILNLRQSDSLISILLLEQFPEIRKWYEHCEDLKTLNALLPRIMLFPDILFTALVKKNSPLCRLFISLSDDKKLEQLLNFADAGSLGSISKLTLILDLTRIDILETLLLRLEATPIALRNFVIPTVKDAIKRAREKNTVMSWEAAETHIATDPDDVIRCRNEFTTLQKSQTNAVSYIFVNNQTLFSSKKRPDPVILAKNLTRKKIKLDESSPGLLTSFKQIVTHPNYILEDLPETLLMWLNSQKVMNKEVLCQIDPIEMDEVVKIICLYKRISLFTHLWNSSSMFQERLLKVSGDALYPIFCAMLSSRSYNDCLIAIFIKASDFITWLQLDDNKNLIEIFILNLNCEAPRISEMIWDTFASVRTWALTATNDNRLPRILDKLMSLPPKLFNELMAEDTPLSKALTSQSEKNATKLVISYAKDTSVTEEKFTRVLSLITNIDVIINVLEKLDQKGVKHLYILPQVEARRLELIPAQEIEFYRLQTRFKL